jgi:isocitrate/isopropylmalate dehydrogenase
MQDLRFQNFIFDEKNLNYTVRLGEKKYHELKPGETIGLFPTETNNHNMRLATIRELMKGHYSSIAQFVYIKEHDPKARTKEGLNGAMKAAYGDSFSLEEDPIVTCIAFTLK